jgi:type II secretory pathway pseudopilin PulG
MLKNLPTQKSFGYTIIEIIVSIFILIIIFSAVQAGYRVFILQKSLGSVKSQIISDIKLAQQYAMSGKKPTGCSGLNGYRFTTISNTDPDLNYYQIWSDCDTDVKVKEVYLKNIAKQVSFTSVNPNVLFKVLGAGTDIGEGLTRTITLSQSGGGTMTIIITPGGEVK